MHAAHQEFLDAIAAKRKLTIRFFDKKEKKEKTRLCAPLDFGPLRGAKEPVDHYQLWDLEGKKKPLNIAVLPDDILELKVLDDTFDPAAIITWTFKPNAWHITRDWGEFS